MTADDFHQARAALGLTQAQMAEALESDLRTIQRWEGGERSIPGPVRVALRLMGATPETPGR